MSKEDKIGVALTKRACFICGQTFDAEIVINTKINKHEADKVKKLHGEVVGFLDEPCDTCKGYMEKGIIVITIDLGKTEDPKNPYRTGGFFVVTEDYIKRLIDNDPEYLEEVLKRKFMFMNHPIAEQLGFFKKDSKNEN